MDDLGAKVRFTSPRPSIRSYNDRSSNDAEMCEDLRAPDRPSESKDWWRKNESQAEVDSLPHFGEQPGLGQSVHRRARSQDDVLMPQPFQRPQDRGLSHCIAAPSFDKPTLPQIPKFDFRSLIFQQQ